MLIVRRRNVGCYVPCVIIAHSLDTQSWALRNLCKLAF